MAKKKDAITKEKRVAKAAMSGMARELTDVTRGKQRVESVLKSYKAELEVEHSPTRTITVDLASAGIAHGTAEGLGYLARLLGDYSMRTAGADGHFAKHVALYSSAPVSLIGGIVYVIELATRDPKALKMTMGRDIASATSNLMVNLGLASTFRALRYWLSQSTQEESEAQAEKNALMNKIAELQKQLGASK